ncbi:hypothetical protein P154DRAFT_238860 [Amniculicola lignicola CBS 123094]|uniref:Uncharacterized protein n=1 Tax=Amniculicola lignicola CBS 123094 TaxID=1392246 RepID=A0A6A5WAV4_9PLEO|nr:hypothetical protein P154DRAFT_238860 [Amniculicola lignicola CBS 123094]
MRRSGQPRSRCLVRVNHGMAGVRCRGWRLTAGAEVPAGSCADNDALPVGVERWGNSSGQQRATAAWPPTETIVARRAGENNGPIAACPCDYVCRWGIATGCRHVGSPRAFGNRVSGTNGRCQTHGNFPLITAQEPRLCTLGRASVPGTAGLEHAHACFARWFGHGPVFALVFQTYIQNAAEQLPNCRMGVPNVPCPQTPCTLPRLRQHPQSNGSNARNARDRYCR